MLPHKRIMKKACACSGSWETGEVLPHRSARLFGAVDSIREDLGALLEAVLQFEYEHMKSATQDVLGEDVFHTSWDEGHNMTLEQAFQFALSQT